MTHVTVLTADGHDMHTEVCGGRTVEETLEDVTDKLSGSYEIEVRKAYAVLPTKVLETYKYDSETGELTKQ